MKFCGKCKANKPYSDFNVCKDRVDGLQTQCRECKKEYSKSWYPDNKDRHRLKTTKTFAINLKQWYVDILRSLECLECGEKRIPTLQFDHINPAIKTMSVSEAMRRKKSKEFIIEEMSKCQVLCANCHAVKTAKDRSWYSLTDHQN